ncbi:hypothetical protein LX16_2053 [Stackebrandtia albiflava]|uniref:LPXTG-motif cell wall-anchored protein n=1 Tax=Stackebrandtia albiflava TaxID=406432 RepID=A0A562VER5_9ACTN|nr:hypothetical protein [Stackebrandtia albiflava]TWJ16324.1 hypothetical protein LX16_2053 [Stackebrandtia albiflava]
MIASRRLGRIPRAAGAALVLVFGLLVAVGPVTSSAAYAIDHGRGTPGYCPDANGVTVVVDFQELGGDVVIRCAPGDQATGLTALKNAGIQITGTNRWGEAFICRIEGKPGPAEESCIDTPPATAYWAYWHSPDGGDWSYSRWGVTNRKPPPGSFEGWSFSKDKNETTNPPPRIDPVRPAAPDSGDDAGTTGGPAGDGTEDHGDGDSAGSGEDTPTEEETTTADDPPSDAPLPGTEVSPTEAPGWTGGDDDMRNTSAESGASGVPTSTLVALGGIAALIAGSCVVGWRRRSRQRADAALCGRRPAFDTLGCRVPFTPARGGCGRSDWRQPPAAPPIRCCCC